MHNYGEALTKNTMVFGILSAILFAVAFALLGISGSFVNDVIFGAVAGASTGVLIAFIVGVIEQGFLSQKEPVDFVALTISNAIIGMFVGALVATFAVIIMAQVMSYIIQPPGPVVWGVFLGRLVGTPLGVLIGLIIGASWRWLHLKIAGNHLNSA